MGFCDISMQNAAEALFVKRVGVEYLPLAFLGSSIILVGTTSALGWLVVNKWKSKLLSIILAVLSISIIPIWLLIKLDINGSVVLLILLFEQVKAVSLLVFWIAMGKILTARQAKRLFAPLLAGVTAGTILGSFLCAPVGGLIGIENLIALAAIVLAIGAGFSLVLESKSESKIEKKLSENPSPRQKEKPEGGVKESVDLLVRLWQGNTLFKLLLLATVCSGLLMPMIYFEFNYVADLATSGSGGEQKLLSLYGQLRGWMYTCILLIQLSFASRIFQYIGVPMAITLSPLIYFFGFIGLSLFMSLPVGIAAVASAQLQDKAIYTPGIRVLYNLFPEDIKSTAISLLDGPVMRIGCALGSISVLVIINLGSPVMVGYFGIPVSLLWIMVAVYLCKLYPSLLMKASQGIHRLKDRYEGVIELFDPATMRALRANLLDSNVKTSEAAISILLDAPPAQAVSILVACIKNADQESRLMIFKTLDQVIKENQNIDIDDTNTIDHLQAMLNNNDKLTEYEITVAIHTYGRLLRKRKAEDEKLTFLEQFQKEGSDAVKLSATVAINRLNSESGSIIDSSDLVRELPADVSKSVREVLLREILSILMEQDQLSEPLLVSLARLLESEDSQLEAIQAIALVSEKFYEKLIIVSEDVLRLRVSSDVKTRIAVMNFIGKVGLAKQAPWLISRLESVHDDEYKAAYDSITALGEKAVNTLMIEHRFGKRTKRNAIISIFRELKVKQEALLKLYNQEIDLLKKLVLDLAVIKGEASTKTNSVPASLLLKRLDERIDEGLHASLMLLTAIHDDDRIAEIADHLRVTTDNKQLSILVEALETLLNANEKKTLVPLVENRQLDKLSKRYSKELDVALPEYELTLAAMIKSSDELTRMIAAATVSDEVSGSKKTLVDYSRPKEKLNPVDIAEKIVKIPLFEGLSTRQLIDLANVVTEEKFAKNSLVFKEGDNGTSMYLVVHGEVSITKGETILNTLGSLDIFGEMAVLEKEKRSATVVAKTACRLLRLDGDELLKLIDEQPRIAIEICKYLSKRIQKLNKRLHGIETGNLEEAVF